MKVKSFFLKFIYEISGGVAGAILGWCYWYFVGCSSGACLITSYPLNSTIYGAVVGAVSFSLLRKKR